MADNDKIHVTGHTAMEGTKIQVHLTRAALVELMDGTRRHQTWRHPQDADTEDWDSSSTGGVYEVELRLTAIEDFSLEES